MARTWLSGDFDPQPWSEIREFLAGMGDFVAHEVAIVDSITTSDVADQLLGSTSMHSLIVAAAPLPEGPVERILVHAPNAIPAPRPGHVIIEHRSYLGRDDRIERPTEDSVPLFWRFVSEKFGITATRAPD